jgi:hypothetical protein
MINKGLSILGIPEKDAQNPLIIPQAREICLFSSLESDETVVSSTASSFGKLSLSLSASEGGEGELGDLGSLSASHLSKLTRQFDAAKKKSQNEFWAKFIRLRGLLHKKKGEYSFALSDYKEGILFL